MVKRRHSIEFHVYIVVTKYLNPTERKLEGNSTKASGRHMKENSTKTATTKGEWLSNGIRVRWKHAEHPQWAFGEMPEVRGTS
jgi:hypothetical protein